MTTRAVVRPGHGRVFFVGLSGMGMMKKILLALGYNGDGVVLDRKKKKALEMLGSFQRYRTRRSNLLPEITYASTS